MDTSLAGPNTLPKSSIPAWQREREKTYAWSYTMFGTVAYSVPSTDPLYLLQFNKAGFQGDLWQEDLDQAQSHKRELMEKSCQIVREIAKNGSMW